MSLGKNLFNARKKAGLSQEETAQKLDVSRQTISKWETDETLPDICQAKKLADLYNVSLEELIEFDTEVREIQKIIEKTNASDKIDWTKMWGKRYPILIQYQKEVKVEQYSIQLREMLSRLKKDYGYSDQDACLVLKDILAHTWNSKKK